MNQESFEPNSAGILIRSANVVNPDYMRRSQDLPVDIVVGMMFGDEGK